MEREIEIISKVVSEIEDPELRAKAIEALISLASVQNTKMRDKNSKSAIRARLWREKKKSVQSVQNAPLDVPPNGSPHTPFLNPPLIPPIPESPNGDSCSSRLKVRRESEREFEEIWKLFPRKVGKGQARKAYIAARKHTEYETIRNGVERLRKQSSAVEDPKFIPHPSTWLNGERWLDEAGLNLVVDNVSDRRGPSRADIEEIERRYCADDA